MQKLIKSCLLLSLLMIPIKAEFPKYALVSEDFKNVVLELRDNLPHHSWSREFHELCELIEEGKVAIPCDTAKKVVEECRHIMRAMNEVAGRAHDVECYYKALHHGEAVVAEDELNSEAPISRRKKCKTFNRLIVRCLLNILGNATVAGDLTVAGATNLNGVTNINGALNIGGTSFSIAGGSTLSSLLVLGASVLDGTLDVGGAATLASLGVTGNETVGGTLGVTGATTLAGLTNVGASTLNGGVVNIGSDATGNAINIGTGAAARTLTLGNVTGATAVNINGGTGGINLNAAGNVGVTPATATVASPTATAVINARVGQATFTGFTTANGTSQVFTITDSFATATSAILVSAANTGGNDAQMTITRVNPAAGSFAVTLTNNGATALNGDVEITFWVLN